MLDSTWHGVAMCGDVTRYWVGQEVHLVSFIRYSSSAS